MQSKGSANAKRVGSICFIGATLQRLGNDHYNQRARFWVF